MGKNRREIADGSAKESVGKEGEIKREKQY